MKKSLFVLLLCLLSFSVKAKLTSGTYYIQNVATGTFLTAGANYGYRGVLREHGLDFKVTGSGTTFTLKTRLSEDNYVLKSTDGYMDGASGTWRITELEDGTFSMYSPGTAHYYGYNPDYTYPYIPRLDAYTSSDSPNTHWRFLTREQLTEGLSEATKEKPLDASFLITAPDFLRGDHRIITDKCWGLDLTGTGGNKEQASTLLNSHNAEKFNTAEWNVTQTLKGIPNGIYSLSVQGFYRCGTNTIAQAAYVNGTDERLAIFYAADKSVPLPSVFSENKKTVESGFVYEKNGFFVPNTQDQAAQCFTDGYYTSTLTDIVVTDGTLTLGIRKDNKAVESDWACFDNFTLLYYGADLTAIREAALTQIASYEAELAGKPDATFATAVEEARTAVQQAKTEAEISAAVASLKEAHILYQSAGTPNDEPFDLTPLFANASLLMGTEGWDATVRNNGSYTATWVAATDGILPVVETYSGWDNWEMAAFSLTQQLTLSPGTYRLRGHAFYRWGLAYNTDETTGRRHSDAYLMAGENEVAVARLGDVKIPELRPASYANTIYEASAAFKAGLYANELIFTLDSVTTLKVGYKGTYSRKQSWFVGGPPTLQKISDEVLAAETEKQLSAARMEYEALKGKYNEIIAQCEGGSLQTAVPDSLIRVATTLEEAEAAADSLAVCLGTFLTSSEQQFDLTPLIQNPDFETGNHLGWDVFSIGDVGVHTATNPIYQMEGSHGDYLFNSWHEKDDAAYNHFLLQTLRRLPQGAYQLTAMTATNQTTSDLRLTANNTSKAVESVSKDVATQTSLTFILDQVTDVRIGLRSNRWFKADDFHLYFGSVAFRLKQEAYRQLAEYEKVAVQSTDRTAYDKVVAQAREGIETTNDETAIDSIMLSVFNALKAMISTTEPRHGQWDITSLLANPDFSQGNKGWTQSSPCTIGYGVVEAFDNVSFVLRQTLAKMPSGEYTLSMQGFHRNGEYSSLLQSYMMGKVTSGTRLFLGKESFLIKSIFDDTRFYAEGNIDDMKPMPDGSSFPNTMERAADAFRRAQYWNVIRTTLTDVSDLSMGLILSSGAENNWLAFGNFHLYYGPSTDLLIDTLTTLPAAKYANVTSQRMLKAGRLNAICLPYEASLSDFKAVYEVGGMVGGKALLVPARRLQLGRCYLVEVETDRPLSASDALVSGWMPDSIPVLWDGTFQKGAPSIRSVQDAYVLSDDGGTFERCTSARLPACTPAFYLPQSADSVKSIIPIEILADWENMTFTPQLENYQAHEFLNLTTYDETSESVIGSFNTFPPARRDFPAPVAIPIPLQERYAATQKITISTTPDFSASPHTESMMPGTLVCYVNNFIPGTTYYYKVETGTRLITRGQFTPKGHLRMIYVRSGSNIRDLGGWPVAGGNRIRYGLIYRGGELHAGHQTILSASDLAELRRLGIAAEVDLRQDVDFADEVATKSAFGEGVPYYYFNQSLFEADALQQYKVQYLAAFNFIIDNLLANRPVYFHCIWGADRTGALAFLLEGLLGVSRSDMYKDYELTSFSKAGTREKTGLDSKFAYIDTFEGDTQQQRFFNYLNSAVGVPTDKLNALIRVMTEEPADGVDPVIGSDRSHSADALVYDLSGRRIAHTSHLRKGVYVINGRKLLKN